MGKVLEGPWTKKADKKTNSEGTETEVSFEGDSWLLPTDIEILNKAGNAFVNKLLQNGWYQDEADELRYGFQEALANAIVHGNLRAKKGAETEENILKTTGDRAEQGLENHPEGAKLGVQVIFDVNKDKVRVEVIDQGPGFDPGSVADPRSEEGKKKASGRGLLLMNSFFGAENVKHENILDEEGKIVGHKVILIKNREIPKEEK